MYARYIRSIKGIPLVARTCTCISLKMFCSFLILFTAVKHLFHAIAKWRTEGKRIAAKNGRK